MNAGCVFLAEDTKDFYGVDISGNTFYIGGTNGLVITGGYTVATLPTGVLGARAYVTDATAPTYLNILTGGGAITCPVFYDGTNWVST